MTAETQESAAEPQPPQNQPATCPLAEAAAAHDHLSVEEWLRRERLYGDAE